MSHTQEPPCKKLILVPTFHQLHCKAGDYGREAHWTSPWKMFCCLLNKREVFFISSMHVPLSVIQGWLWPSHCPQEAHSLEGEPDRPTDSDSTGRVMCMGQRNRTSFKGVGYVWLHEALCLVEPLFKFMFCCYCPEILNNFWARGPTFSFSIGPQNCGAFPTQDILLASADGDRNGAGKGDALEELKTRGKWERTLLIHRGVNDHDTARTPSILG